MFLISLTAFCLFFSGLGAEFAVPLGLPPIPWPEDNPYSKKKAELGRLLYFDKRLSSDGTISCGSCHSIPHAFTDRHPISEGIHGHHGTRHAPTVINSAYQKHYFWDGRADSLEEQCRGPLSNPQEMTSALSSKKACEQCVKRVRSIPGYRLLFKEVFGSDRCSIDEIVKAIATFERTVLSGNSPYDRYKAGDKTALSKQQIAGHEIFVKTGCINCHAGFTFTDGRFLNIGIGIDKPEADLGRYAITHHPSDKGAFKVPTLRDVENTHPYMHDGSLTSLGQVVDYYDRGGNPNPNLNPLIRPLHLTQEEKKALISFLNSLSGEGWEHFKEPDHFPE